MSAIMGRLGLPFELVAMETSNFIKPASAMFQLDGKRRRWDVIESHSSVGIVIYHSDIDAFIIVRQFRPPVYACAMREAKLAGSVQPLYSAGAHFTNSPGAQGNRLYQKSIEIPAVKLHSKLLLLLQWLFWQIFLSSAVIHGLSAFCSYTLKRDVHGNGAQGSRTSCARVWSTRPSPSRRSRRRRCLRSVGTGYPLRPWWTLALQWLPPAPAAATTTCTTSR